MEIQAKKEKDGLDTSSSGLLGSLVLDIDGIVIEDFLEETQERIPIAPMRWLRMISIFAYVAGITTFIIILQIELTTFTEQTQVFSYNADGTVTQGSSYAWSCSMLSQVTKEASIPKPTYNDDVYLGYYLGNTQTDSKQCSEDLTSVNPCRNVTHFAGVGEQSPWPANSYVMDVQYTPDGKIGYLVQKMSYERISIEYSFPTLYIYDPATASMTRCKAQMKSGPFTFVTFALNNPKTNKVEPQIMIFSMRNFNDWNLFYLDSGRDWTGSYEKYQKTYLKWSSDFPSDKYRCCNYYYTYVADVDNVVMTSVIARQPDNYSAVFTLTGGQPGAWGNAGGVYEITMSVSSYYASVSKLYGNYLNEPLIGNTSSTATISENYPSEVIASGNWMETCASFARGDTELSCPYSASAKVFHSKADPTTSLLVIDHPQIADAGNYWSCNDQVPYGFYASCGSTATINRFGAIDGQGVYTELGRSIYSQEFCDKADELVVGETYNNWCAPVYNIITDSQDNFYVFTPSIMAQMFVNSTTKALSFKIIISLNQLNFANSNQGAFTYGQVDDDFEDTITEWPLVFGNWYVYKNHYYVNGYYIQPSGSGRIPAMFDKNDDDVIFLPDGFTSTYERSHTNFLWAYRISTKKWSSFKSFSAVYSGWFLCGNKLQDNIITDIAEIEGECQANGIEFFNKRTEVSTFQNTYLENVKDSYVCDPSVYKYICADISFLPPYNCIRNTTTSTLTAMSAAIANAEALFGLFVLFIGFVLSKKIGCCAVKEKENDDKKDNRGEEEARDDKMKGAKAIEMKNMDQWNDSTVENPIQSL